MKTKVIIIGAGASGMYAGLQLKNQSVTLLEQNSKVANKMRLSGAGQCNFTHNKPIQTFLDCYGEKRKFVKKALQMHSNQEVMRMLESIGIKSYIREDGKVFPASLKSDTIIDAFKDQMLKAGHLLVTEVKVLSVTYEEKEFKVVTSKGCYRAEKVIVATGGLSYPQLGVSGVGYEIARAFNHEIIPLRQGLTPVYTHLPQHEVLQGMVFPQAKIHRAKGKEMPQAKPLLMTHFGLSGPLILDYSRYFQKNDLIEINWLGLDKKQLEDDFLACVQTKGKEPVAYFMNRLGLPERLKKWLEGALKIDFKQKMSTVSKAQRRKLLDGISAFPCKVEDLGPYEQSMVTVGGVSTEEIHPQTMMSKNREGLYFVGEVLDVDGETGGFNIQWAFSSAYCAAKDINEGGSKR